MNNVMDQIPTMIIKNIHKCLTIPASISPWMIYAISHAVVVEAVLSQLRQPEKTVRGSSHPNQKRKFIHGTRRRTIMTMIRNPLLTRLHLRRISMSHRLLISLKRTNRMLQHPTKITGRLPCISFHEPTPRANRAL